MDSVATNNMGASSPTSGPIEHPEKMLMKSTGRPLRAVLKRKLPVSAELTKEKKKDERAGI